MTGACNAQPRMWTHARTRASARTGASRARWPKAVDPKRRAAGRPRARRSLATEPKESCPDDDNDGQVEEPPVKKQKTIRSKLKKVLVDNRREEIGVMELTGQKIFKGMLDDVIDSEDELSDDGVQNMLNKSQDTMSGDINYHKHPILDGVGDNDEEVEDDADGNGQSATDEEENRANDNIDDSQEAEMSTS